MRVIENKMQEVETVCPHCHSRFAYNNSDVQDYGWESYLRCPCCDNLIHLQCENDDIPTIDKVQYPKDFYSFDKGVHIKDEEISEWVKQCTSFLDKDNDYSFCGSGDTMVFAYKSDEDSSTATVIVAKKYEEGDVKIPKEKF